MNNEITVTAIIAIIAIIAPIIITLIDKFFDNVRYVKEAESARQHMMLDKESSLVDNYLISLGAVSVLYSYNNNIIIQYKKSFYVLLPYVSKETKDLMLAIDALVLEDNYKIINKYTNELARLFKKY